MAGSPTRYRALRLWAGVGIIALLLGLLTDSVNVISLGKSLFRGSQPKMSFQNVDGMQPGFELSPFGYTSGTGFTEVQFQLMLQIRNEADEPLTINSAYVAWSPTQGRDGKVRVPLMRPSVDAQIYQTLGELEASRFEKDTSKAEEIRSQHRHALPFTIAGGNTIYAIIPAQYSIQYDGVVRTMKDANSMLEAIAPIGRLTKEGDVYVHSNALPLRYEPVVVATDRGSVRRSTRLIVLVAGASIRFSPEMANEINNILEASEKTRGR